MNSPTFEKRSRPYKSMGRMAEYPFKNSIFGENYMKFNNLSQFKFFSLFKLNTNKTNTLYYLKTQLLCIVTIL